jgi:hypothetical protein
MKRLASPPAKKTTKHRILRAGLLLLAAALLFLIHDILITHILAHRICKADPQPKTFIKKTVEYPESIYWEDNIYPGFDEQDRLLMIRNYLDGVHLKTMALNAPDGTIHVYTATEEDWQARRGEPNYFDRLNTEAKAIAERGTTFTREAMPRTNYSVILSPAPLTSFQRRYLWSDEVRITDNKTDEVIAYNRRLMRRWYMIMPDIAFGNRYYSPEVMCGYDGFERFDEDVVSGHARKFFPSKHRELLNQRIYRKLKEVF